MTTNTARQPKGVPVGGQFAATAHDESSIVLAAPPRALPELEPYGEIPAPLEGQTLETGEPAEATFEDSYRAFFAPLDEHEAAHGPYATQPPLSEGEILDLAGIGNENLGRHRGTFLERDENTGEPVIVVHTRNGGGNRECYQDDCDGQCTGCIQTDAIPALPTYLRDEDDDGDCTYANNYFRPLDPAAGLSAIEAEEHKQALNRLLYFRDAITAGKQPPWAVLSPVRGREERQRAYAELLDKRREAGQHASRRRIAASVDAAVENGTVMPTMNMMRIPSEKWAYDRALGNRDKFAQEAFDARTAADALAQDMQTPLPPRIAALVAAEHGKLSGEAQRLEARKFDNNLEISTTGEAMKKWSGRMIAEADKAVAAETAAEAKLKDFDWSACFPGDVENCPPRPTDS